MNFLLKIIRFIDTLLHLNNLKLRVVSAEGVIQTLGERNETLTRSLEILAQKNETLTQSLETLAQKNETLTQSLETLSANHATLSESLQPMVDKSVAHQLYYQSLSLQHRIDQLGCDARILPESTL